MKRQSGKVNSDKGSEVRDVTPVMGSFSGMEVSYLFVFFTVIPSTYILSLVFMLIGERKPLTLVITELRILILLKFV